MHKTYQQARRHLGRRDAVLKQLIGQIGPCTLEANGEHFALLVRSIISQQISAKAAISIGTKVVAATGRSGLTPRGILKLSDEALRTCGLSASKVKSVRDLAEKVAAKTVPLASLGNLNDEEAIERLILVRGIGRWTAEMFLIFSLGRLDVWPVDDLGVRMAVRDLYELEEVPGKAYLTALGEPWRPYRSVATWYLWRSRGGVPQSSEPEA